MKILHIGLGIRGSHWLGFVKDYAGAATVGCVDPDADALARAKSVVTDGQCGFYEDLPRALAEAGADAALIASPSRLHKEQAIAALRSGLTVMVEKPLAQSVADATEIIAAAGAAGKRLVVAENYRYWPAERTIRKMILGGELGRIDNVTLVDRRHQPARTEGPWLARTEYPQLSEIGIHHFDSLRAWLGTEADSIQAQVWNPPGSDYQHGACSQAVINFGGIRVNYLGTLTSDRFSFSTLIEGEKGSIWSNRKYVFFRKAGSRLFLPVRNVKVPAGDATPYPQGGTTSLLDSLRNAIDGVEAETSGADNLRTVVMVEAAKRSDREGRVVAMNEILGS